MIKAEMGKVQITGTGEELLFEFGTIAVAMIREFGKENVISAIAASMVVLKGKETRVDMSDLTKAMEKLKDEDKEDE